MVTVKLNLGLSDDWLNMNAVCQSLIMCVFVSSPVVSESGQQHFIIEDKLPTNNPRLKQIMTITDRLQTTGLKWRECDYFGGQDSAALLRLMPVQLLTFCVHIPAEIYFLSKSTVTFLKSSAKQYCTEVDRGQMVFSGYFVVYMLVQMIKDIYNC